MKGVSYLVDDDGNKTAVVLDLTKHRDLLEDIHDRMLVASRKHEPRETLEQVRKRLLTRQGSVKRNG
jgi:hypothetical protein